MKEEEKDVNTDVDESTEETVDTSTTEEDESSKEVNTEDEEVKDDDTQTEDDDGKMQGQVDNLNKALRQERDSRKADKDKISNLEKRLEENDGTMDKLKNVFVPEDRNSEDDEPQYMTRDEMDSFYEEKEKVKQIEVTKVKQQDQLKKEISELETEWDGKNGKPKYDDDEVLEWQKKNEKLNLTPKSAFLEMKLDDIVDYKTKTRKKSKPDVENVESPGGSPDGREPAERSEPMSEQETRSAVIEAMEAAENEGND